MQINKIIKQAVKRLEREGKILTPDFYAEAFCKETKLAGVQVDDCSHVGKLLEMLDPKFQKEIKNYRIQTLSELARFLIANINRTSETKCSEQLEAQFQLNKSILKAIELLHNQEARELAKKSLELLNVPATKTQVEYFKQLWDNFIGNYDDTFLYKLQALGDVDTLNLKKTIENLQIVHKDTQKNVDLKKIAASLVTSLIPSISAHVSDDIESLSQALQNSPEILFEDFIEEQVRQAVRARIALDKQSVKEMVDSLDEVLDKLSLRLIGMIEQSDGSTAEIQRIKKELESFTKESESNFKLAHKQLYTIAIALEENTIDFRSNLEGHSQEVDVLKKRVKELESELKKAKEEAKIDFLTNLYNKRALNEFLRIKESKFQRFGRNFSIVMFDLDHFKQVNDTYGHDAGDVILKAFASILKKDSRDVDIVGRFGGEEFMAILSETEREAGARYAQKVRNHVEKAKFMYKGKRISVTVSAGVSEHARNSSLEQTIEKADENLYKAKREGRNKVAY